MVEKATVDFATAQGTTDALKAALRYLGVVSSIVVAVIGLLGKGDAAGASEFLQTNMGDLVLAVIGLVGFGVAVYGVIRTAKRGFQAAVPRINADPDKIK